MKNIFTFEDLKNYTNLNPEDVAMDMLCFESACERIENHIGYRLEERETTEIQAVKDNRVILGNKNPTKVISIRDMDTKKCVKKFVVDRKNHSIYFIDLTLENHSLFVKYKAGFTSETLPQNLKLATVKMFIATKNEMTKLQNGEAASDVLMPEDVKEMLVEYSKPRL